MSMNEMKMRKSDNTGTVRLDIGEGKGIHIEFPAALSGGEREKGVQIGARSLDGGGKETKVSGASAEWGFSKKNHDYVAGEFKKAFFKVKDVRLGEETSLENGVLTIRKSLSEEALKISPLVEEVTLDLIRPENYDVFTTSIMDFIPIAVKKEGVIGEGLTFELKGAVTMLTGHQDASPSDGIFSERVEFGRSGAADKGEFMIRVNVIVKERSRTERPGPMAAHRASEVITQEIREVLKKKDISQADEVVTVKDYRRPGKPRVVYVKEIMGQGAMHDNIILPEEPCGYAGGRANVDLGNIPIFLTANEVRDGGIHNLCCITPDTKETTRCYYREPVVQRLAEDEEIDFAGVLFVGSPQANTDKYYGSVRVGATVEAMGADGCIISTEGFGNNHVDFAFHHEQIGKRGIAVVGTSFCGDQGALVVGNKYMDAMVDMCVVEEGWETAILCQNSMSEEVALRCVAMLKDKLAGKDIGVAERKWTPAVVEYNQEEVERVYGCERD